MTPTKLAEVVTNARAKVTAGDADYLDEAVVHLADAAHNAEVLLSPLLTAVALTTGGFEAKIDGKGMAQVMAHAFWGLLTETQAKNYVTITFEREGREIEVIVQKREARTAHDLRLEAEAERDAMAAENARLREQNVRLVALLESDDTTPCIDHGGVTAECANGNLCWEARRLTLLAEIKAGA